MFIGHLAVAYAAKRAVPKASLGVLFAASQLPDLIWPVLVLTGTEKVVIRPGVTAFAPLDFVSYPWSHSLLMVTLAGGLAGLLYGWRTRYASGGIAIAALAVSHWLLDWISHRPDLPLYPHGPLLGLGLWNSVAGTMLVEGGLFLSGVALYTRATRPLNVVGSYAHWALVVFLGAIYVADRFSAPPPSERAVAWVGLVGGIILFLWAQGVDRHRRYVTPH